MLTKANATLLQYSIYNIEGHPLITANLICPAKNVIGIGRGTTILKGGIMDWGWGLLWGPARLKVQLT